MMPERDRGIRGLAVVKTHVVPSAIFSDGDQSMREGLRALQYSQNAVLVRGLEIEEDPDASMERADLLVGKGETSFVWPTSGEPLRKRPIIVRQAMAGGSLNCGYLLCRCG
jgi:hypothetical protein